MKFALTLLLAGMLVYVLGCTELPTDIDELPTVASASKKGGNGGGGDTPTVVCVTGETALNDLGAGFFTAPDGLDYQGGLYPGGAGNRPPSHEALAPAVAPVNGKIGVVVIGASTANLFAQALIPTYNARGDRNPAVSIVNAGAGNRYADDWSTPNSAAWRSADRAISSAGLTNDQVLVAFVKTFATNVTPSFPEGPAENRDHLLAIFDNLYARYPNLKQVYVTDEGYGGWAGAELGYYSTGFSVKWAIEARLDRADPWVSWGTYFWADGLGEECVEGEAPFGRADGLEWAQSDFQSDGVHQSNVGADKQATLFIDALVADPVASLWFVVS